MRLPTGAFVVSTDLQHAILYAGTDREDVLSRGLSRRYRRAFRRDIATIKFREAHLAKRERPIICAGKSARGDPPPFIAQIRGQAISAREILHMRENSILDQSTCEYINIEMLLRNDDRLH